MKVEDRSFCSPKSPYDVRDYKLACVGSADSFPDTFELRTVSVKDQGSASTCVAHACSSIIEYNNLIQEKESRKFSTEFIYGYRPSGYYIGEGMYLRDALKTISKLGDCYYEDLKGNHNCPDAIANVEANLEKLRSLAHPHRISSYVKLTSIEEIKQSLVDNGYVLMMMAWHKDYKLKNGIYTYTSAETRGNHAMIIYGWNKDGWLVHNSWGKNWGRQGRFILPFSYPILEAWGIIDTIKSNQSILHPADNLFIKIFSKLINFIVNLIRKRS